MKPPKNVVINNVSAALLEDLNNQEDITALLIPEEKPANAQIITKEATIICGQDWVNEVFKQLDQKITIEWNHKDGDKVEKGKTICKLQGSARKLLTGERTALNFLQLLSGTATITNKYVRALANTQTKLLDTRKTIPGLRLAQKYAVLCGDGNNHRLGLYDAFLIKENHISACGSISTAVENARKIDPSKPIEVEVENLQQLNEALKAKANIIMLDNFSLDQIREAVTISKKQAKLEISGNVTLENITKLATTGIDYISVGALTKSVNAIDFTMLFNK